MEILFLKKLKAYNRYKNISSCFGKDIFRDVGISVDEIKTLEDNWNNGNPFPNVLKELLFLAGKFSNTFDYGIFDSQQELQEFIREDMNMSSKSISRPFYAIEISSSYFFFIYLDEGENPLLYEATPSKKDFDWIRQFNNHTIKSFTEMILKTE